MPQVQTMTVQAKDVHAPAAGAKPAGRARRARLILIAPVAEMLTSPLVFGLLRRRFGERAGYLSGFMWYWLAWGLLSPVGCRARALAGALRATRRRGPGRRAISLAALAGPPAGAPVCCRGPRCPGRPRWPPGHFPPTWPPFPGPDCYLCAVDLHVRMRECRGGQEAR
jgi:hypothetical protein